MLAHEAFYHCAISRCIFAAFAAETISRRDDRRLNLPTRSRAIAPCPRASPPRPNRRMLRGQCAL